MHPVYEKLKLVLGLQSISILVPRIWFHVPHPSNGQKMSKTKPFRQQKRRFLDGARLQEFWLRRAGPREYMHNLNNLYWLIPPLGRRQVFCLRPAERRWVFWTLFVYWVHRLIFRTVFWTKKINGATSFTSKNVTNILIFQTSKNK